MSEVPDLSLALSPVPAPELQELERFVAQVERLASSSFFENPGGKLTMKAERGGPMRIDHPHAGDEAVRAVMPVFRQLYTDTERGSAAGAMAIVKRSAHRSGTHEGRELITLVKAHGRSLREFAAGTFGGELVHNEKTLTNDDILDLWMNGDHMHYDEDKAAVIAAWPKEFLELQLHGAIVGFRNGYWNLANLVRLCLAQPALRGASASAA